MNAPRFIQLKANTLFAGIVDEAASKAEAGLFSLYAGEPGGYRWVADHTDPGAALQHLGALHAHYGGLPEIDRAQFDAVMGT